MKWCMIISLMNQSDKGFAVKRPRDGTKEILMTSARYWRSSLSGSWQADFVLITFPLSQWLVACDRYNAFLDFTTQMAVDIPLLSFLLNRYSTLFVVMPMHVFNHGIETHHDKKRTVMVRFSSMSPTGWLGSKVVSIADGVHSVSLTVSSLPSNSSSKHSSRREG